MKKAPALLSSPKGFTLIELVVVFVVIAILATIGVAALVTYSRTQTLNQATNDLYAAINSAKSLSSSQVRSMTKPSQESEDSLSCLSDQVLNGYGVSINIAQNSYTLYIQCSGQNKTNSAWDVSLPIDISFDQSSATNIFFPVITGAIVSDKNSIVLDGYPGSTKTISINQGNIRILQ
jgi:prepilin-type N-terminal cleavage/methylation domain-containing protein